MTMDQDDIVVAAQRCALRAALLAVPVTAETTTRVCTLAVRRHTSRRLGAADTWHIWARGSCTCGPADWPDLDLEAAVARIAALRPADLARLPRPVAEAA